MGLYNLNGQIELIDQVDIKSNLCPVCKNKGIRSVIGDPSMDSFDYYCDFCKKTISMSSSLLGSDDYWKEYSGNNHAQKELKAEVRNFPAKLYPLLVGTMEFFLGKNYEKDFPIYVYEDWKVGKVPGYPNKYKSINEYELEKINNDQKRILDETVDERLKQSKENFYEARLDSIDSKKYLEFEIETVENLFSREINVRESEANLGNWSISVERLSLIQAYYRQAVNAKINYNVIVSPNQKTKIGTQTDEMNCLIDAIMYSQYLEFLRNEKGEGEASNKKNKDFFDQGELKDINDKIDEVLKVLEKLGLGQEIIYDEIDSFKVSSEKNSKRDFKSLVVGKLVEFVADQAIKSDLAKTIYKTILGDDFPKLLN